MAASSKECLLWNEVSWANLNVNKIILDWQPFMKRVDGFAIGIRTFQGDHLTNSITRSFKTTSILPSVPINALKSTKKTKQQQKQQQVMTQLTARQWPQSSWRGGCVFEFLRAPGGFETWYRPCFVNSQIGSLTLLYLLPFALFSIFVCLFTVSLVNIEQEL